MELLAEEKIDPDAVALLAPAASTVDMKRYVGGETAWDSFYAEAKKTGTVKIRNPFGAEETLGVKWFQDLLVYDDVAPKAAAVWKKDSLVIFGEDDPIIDPENTSRATANALKGEIIDATGDGHGYGFYSDNTRLLMHVGEMAAEFFSWNLVED